VNGYREKDWLTRRRSEATPEQRANFEIIGNGEGVHWPDIDEDISAEGMMYGVPASRAVQPAIALA